MTNAEKETIFAEYKVGRNFIVDCPITTLNVGSLKFVSFSKVLVPSAMNGPVC